MVIEPLDLDGAAIIRLDRKADERGYFARSFCADTFRAAGLPDEFPQHNVSFTSAAGSIRGLHFQVEPHQEPKVISCIQGAIFDVIVDLRRGSKTYGGWFSAELSPENGDMLYAPPGFAHGFQTLRDNCTVSYMMGTRYLPGAAAGIRYDDPHLGIPWPLPVSVISPRDLALPLLSQI
jgi:dTDP-4-dehydrorhamnose 3,5-epimerase